MYKNDKVKLCNDHELLGSIAMSIVSYGITYSPPILVRLPCLKLDKKFILKDNRCIKNDKVKLCNDPRTSQTYYYAVIKTRVELYVRTPYVRRVDKFDTMSKILKNAF